MAALHAASPTAAYYVTNTLQHDILIYASKYIRFYVNKETSSADFNRVYSLDIWKR